MSGFFGAADNGDDSLSVLDLTAAMICTALTSPFDTEQEVTVGDRLARLDVSGLERKKSFCDTRSSPLPKNSILQKLLVLQRHAEIADHEAKELR